MKFNFLSIVIFFVLLINNANAQTTEWKLVWDMNSESDMKEYIIYRTTSGNQSAPPLTIPHNVDTEISTRNLEDSTITFLDKNLEKGQIYYYQIRAVDETGLESDLSNTVHDYIPELDHRDQCIVIQPGDSIYTFDLRDNLIFPVPDSVRWYIFSDGSMIETTQKGKFGIEIIPATGQLNVTADSTDTKNFSLAVQNARGFYDTCNVRIIANYAPEIENKRITQKKITDTITVYDSTWYNLVRDEDHEDEELDYRIIGGNHVSAKRSDVNNGYQLEVLNAFTLDTLTLIVSDPFCSDTAHFVVEFEELTGIEYDLSTYPNHFYLLQNSPNPFNPETQIKFGLPKSGQVTIMLFNILGQKVATILNTYKEAGNHTVSFQAGGLPSGHYFYSIFYDSFYQTKKMMLLK